MSETVHYKGKLIEVEKLNNETIEEQCKRLMEYKELPSYYDNHQEMLSMQYYKQYVIYNDILYSVDKKEIDTDEDIFEAAIDNDGIINFEVKYYDGGCSFNEAIEYALEKLV